MREYSRRQVEEIIGIPARRIQFYTDNGLVTPANENPGRGIERRYSKGNLFQLLLVKELATHGVTLSGIKAVTNSLIKPMKGKGVNWFNIDDSALEKLKAYWVVIWSDGTLEFQVKAGIESVVNEDEGVVVEGQPIKVEQIELDMAGRSSAVIIHIGNLAEQLPST